MTRFPNHLERVLPRNYTPKDAKTRTKDQRTRGPKDQRTKGPEDQGTREGPRDQRGTKTKGPDQATRTKVPKDQATREPAVREWGILGVTARAFTGARLYAALCFRAGSDRAMACLVASHVFRHDASWTHVRKICLVPTQTVMWHTHFAVVEAVGSDDQPFLVKVPSHLLRYLRSGRATTFFLWRKGGCWQTGFTAYKKNLCHAEDCEDEFWVYANSLVPSQRSSLSDLKNTEDLPEWFFHQEWMQSHDTHCAGPPIRRSMSGLTRLQAEVSRCLGLCLQGISKLNPLRSSRHWNKSFVLPKSRSSSQKIGGNSHLELSAPAASILIPTHVRSIEAELTRESEVGRIHDGFCDRLQCFTRSCTQAFSTTDHHVPVPDVAAHEPRLSRGQAGCTVHLKSIRDERIPPCLCPAMWGFDKILIPAYWPISQHAACSVEPGRWTSFTNSECFLVLYSPCSSAKACFRSLSANLCVRRK